MRIRISNNICNGHRPENLRVINKVVIGHLMQQLVESEIV